MGMIICDILSIRGSVCTARVVTYRCIRALEDEGRGELAFSARYDLGKDGECVRVC